jgi:hypothetical protein
MKDNKVKRILAQQESIRKISILVTVNLNAGDQVDVLWIREKLKIIAHLLVTKNR